MSRPERSSCTSEAIGGAGHPSMRSPCSINLLVIHAFNVVIQKVYILQPLHSYVKSHPMASNIPNCLSNSYNSSFCFKVLNDPNKLKFIIPSSIMKSSSNHPHFIHPSSLVFMCCNHPLPSGNQTWRAGKWTIQVGDVPMNIFIQSGDFPSMFDDTSPGYPVVI